MSFSIKEFLSKRQGWSRYLLFGLILTAALLYYRFPSDAVLGFVQAKGRAASPRLDIAVERIAPSVLIGLKFMQAKVALEESPDSILLSADRLLVKPKLLSLLSGKTKFSFHCEAYQGDVKGSIYFEKEPNTGFIDTEMALSNIHIGDYSYFSRLLGRPLEGTLGGTVAYSGQYKPMLDGSGEANLKLSDGKLELLQPFLTLKSIDFSEMEVEMVFKKQKIDVTRLALKGKQLQGTLSGSITLGKQFAESSLDLKGTIEPFAALFKSGGGAQDTVAVLKQRLNKGTLSFLIRGTIKAPEVKFT